MKIIPFVVSLIFGSFLFLNNSYSMEHKPKFQSMHLKGGELLRDSRGYLLPNYRAQGNDRIRFLTHWYKPKNWRDRSEIHRNVRDMVNQKSGCHVKDKQRWETLPKNFSALFILAWHNRDSGKFGWFAIKNASDNWYISTNYEPWKIAQKRFSYYDWNSRGTSIQITFDNPDNKNGWTEHDFWYHFSCPLCSK